MAARTDNSASDIEQALRKRVDSLVPVLLPKAVKLPKYWSVGNTRGEAGTQMQINRGGASGVWTDFSETPKTDHGSGDMLMLIAAVHFGGWSAPGAKKKAIDWAKSWLGWDDQDPERIAKVRREAAVDREKADADAEMEAEGRRSSAWAIWKGAVPGAGTPAESYLKGRGIDFVTLGHWPGSLRYLPNCWCPVRRGKYPAMIACIVGLDGKFRGVHRTYLDVSAGKSGTVRNVKVILDRQLGKQRLASPGEKGKSFKLSLGTYTGGHIPVWKGTSPATLREIPRGTPVYGGEGIENSGTIAMVFPDRRVLAGVALSNLGALELPDQAGPFVFLTDNDPEDGQAFAAMERAVVRQQERAATQGRPFPQLLPPDPAYKDWNDQLLGKRIAGASA